MPTLLLNNNDRPLIRIYRHGHASKVRFALWLLLIMHVPTNGRTTRSGIHTTKWSPPAQGVVALSCCCIGSSSLACLLGLIEGGPHMRWDGTASDLNGHHRRIAFQK